VVSYRWPGPYPVCGDFSQPNFALSPRPFYASPAARVCSPLLPLTTGPSPSRLRTRNARVSATMSEFEFNLS